MSLKYKYTFPNSVGLDKFIRLYGNPDHFNDFEVNFKELTVKTKDLIGHTYEIAWYVYEADYFIDHKGIPGFNFKDGFARKITFPSIKLLCEFIYDMGHSGCFNVLKVIYETNDVIVDNIKHGQDYHINNYYMAQVSKYLKQTEKGLFTRDLSDLKSMFNLKE